MYQRMYSEVHFLAQEGDREWNAIASVDRGQIGTWRSGHQLLSEAPKAHSVFLAILPEDML